jgi:hypothetical protein
MGGRTQKGGEGIMNKEDEERRCMPCCSWKKTGASSLSVPLCLIS